MQVTFENNQLKALCEDPKKAQRALGRAGAKKLRTRLADLWAVERVTDLIAGHPHPLKKDRAGQFAVDLHSGWRLVFVPAEEPIPMVANSNSVDWEQITSMRIIYVGDYHD
ncbi:MAG: killer suppression protein HigA [Planctomycetota bacterium]